MHTTTMTPLRRHLLELMSRPFAELAALPESTVLEVASETGDRAVLWKDALPDGRLRIVLQSCGTGFCCTAGLTAQGFLMSPDGTFVDVPKELMYEFQLEG